MDAGATDATPFLVPSGAQPALPVWRRLLGIAMVLAIAAAALASTITGKTLLGGTAPLPPFLLAYFNVSCDAVGFVGCVCGGSGAQRASALRRTARPALLLVLIYQLGNVLYFLGLARLAPSVATLLYQSTTLWVAVLSVAVLREAVHPYNAASVILTLAGSALIAIDNWDGADDAAAAEMRAGVVALCASAALWALYEVLLP